MLLQSIHRFGAEFGTTTFAIETLSANCVQTVVDPAVFAKLCLPVNPTNLVGVSVQNASANSADLAA